jgi:DNA repair photolyase
MAQQTDRPGAGAAAASRRLPAGRGARTNRPGRYERYEREWLDDGWRPEDPVTERVATTALPDHSRTVLSRNDSPDVPFEQSINPYRGCEHGCSYCYARATHPYLGLSAGLDFETRILVKRDAAAVLRRELARPGYACREIALSGNTDPYQPLERSLRVTRGVLEVLAEHDHPVGILTKSALVLRDLDILAPMAQRGLARVVVSITTLDRHLARVMEPRAAAPERRLDVLRAVSAAGVPAGALVAPVVPALTDHEVEPILAAAHAAGARTAAYVLLRLPHELKDLFRDWLEATVPGRARHVLSRLREMRGGRDYDPEFEQRKSGRGAFAQLLEQRFELARRRLGLDGAPVPLRTDLFRVPGRGRQLGLWG